MKNIKVIFMGTPAFSVPVLEALITNYSVIRVVTQPDKKTGRNQEITYSEVKKVALKHNIPLLQPINIKNEENTILDLKPDLIITCAYGQIIPKTILEIPQYKCINVHASLLPKLRGGAPIHRAIMEGNYKTGVTIMYMDEKMDHGPILSQQEVAITEQDTAGLLHNKLSLVGRDLLLETIPKVIRGEISPLTQKEREATYAWVLTKDDELINWDQDKRRIFNQIRGLNPWPVAYTHFEGKIVKIWSTIIGYNSHFEKINGEIVAILDNGIVVKVFDGEIIITELQPEGKVKMQARDYINGLKEKDKLIGRVFY